MNCSAPGCAALYYPLSMKSCPHCHATVGETDSSCPACKGALVSEPGPTDPELLAGNFRRIRLIGSGGMGAVWLAEDVGLQRQVAVKLLAEKLCHEPELVERFLREARLMAKIDHPNVVPVYFVGRWKHVPFIVMKLLSGQPLSEWARARPLTLTDVAGIARQVCSGLTALHAQGIIHRDIKPANIFIGDDGRVLLLDLGVARESDSSLTQTGALIGTPRYMPPEQVQGREVDASCDVYSLGVVLYELFAGRRMFDVDSNDSVLRAHVYARPEPLTRVSEPVWKVLEKALEKEPAQRFRTAAEFSQALDAAVGAPGDLPSETYVGPWKTKATPLSQVGLDATVPSAVRKRRVALFTVMGVSAMIGAGAALWALRPPAPEAPPPLAPPQVPKVVIAEPPKEEPVVPVDAGVKLTAATPAPSQKPASGRGATKPPPPREEAPPPLLPR